MNVAQNEDLRARYLAALGLPDFLHHQKITAPQIQPKVEQTVEQKVKSKPQSQIEPQISTQCLLIETCKTQSFCQASATRDLLLKMLAAINLSSAECAFCCIEPADFSATLKRYNAKTVLIMSADLPASKAYFYTHHPSKILANSALKREAWEVLKQLKLCLK